MRTRHPVPRVWLITDERMGDDLWHALKRMPRGGGVIFRHYSLPSAERRALFARIRKVASRRALVLIRAGSTHMRGEAGVHNQRRAGGLLTRSAHTRRELLAARRVGADAVLVSPVFATQSHPGARTLGPVRLGLMTVRTTMRIVALGGMNREKLRRLAPLRLFGWAAIDAWR